MSLTDKPGKRAAAVLAVAMLAVTVHAIAFAEPAPAGEQPAPAGELPRPPAGPIRTVTLLTGDKVRLAGDAVTVEPGPGRDMMAFRTHETNGHVSVIPIDAAPLLATGKLDPRLFDVTTLVADGYDDRRTDLPLLVQAKTTPAGVRMDRKLPGLGAQAVRQDRKQPGAFWKSVTAGTVPKVWLDGRRKLTLDESVPQIGAPQAWAQGFTGKGVTVAVLDSGVDDTHPDLAGKIAARANFTEDTEDDQDHVGHGTHVASTIAGNGARYRGVAPDATLLDGKVCVVDGCAESWILAGMEWAAVTRHARVVNLSLGGYDSPGVDPLEAAIDALSAEYGTLFVVAAGNDGPPAGSIDSPASADAALAVGAVDKSDQIAGFSGRGPRTGDEALKPDLTAPGVNITAAAPGGGYATMSGTSMATPHVAGAAALLGQEHPGWTGERLKSVLMESAKPADGVGAYTQGAGRVDVAAAIGQAVTASPPSISFGKQLWPHTDDEVLTRQVTFHNSGSSDATLPLAGSGVFTVQPATITVPAGGDATATVSADTRGDGPVGLLTGAITGGGLHLPVAVDREAESYTLTAGMTGFDGQPTDGLTMTAISWDTGVEYPLDAATRLPKGRYAVSGTALDLADPKVAWVVQPLLELDADRAVAFDARQAVASDITVPEPSAAIRFAAFGYTVPTPSGPIEDGIFSNSFDYLRTAQVGDDAPGFASYIHGVWAAPGADSPYSYAIRYQHDGAMTAGFRHAVARPELVTVKTTYRGGNDPAMTGAWFETGRLPGQETHAAAVALPFRLPFTAVRYFNSDGQVEWKSRSYEVWEDDSGNGCICGWTAGPWTHYPPGRAIAQTWNPAVFGPVFPGPGDLDAGATRSGDTIGVDLPLYGDGDGRQGNSGDTGSTALYRAGTLIGTSDAGGNGTFTVPAAADSYRLVTHSERGAPYALSTSTDAAWTFRSAHTGGSSVLPLWTIRFSPATDATNTAASGRTVPVRVTAVPAPGAAVGRVTALTVESSVDDGAAWRPAPMVGGAALIAHPAGSGFVSLRATLRDSAGNGVTLTIAHAYRYG